MTGATGNLYCGLHEFGDMGFLLHFLRPEDLFIDVGANVGSFSVLAAGVVGAKCLALEAVPSTFADLTRNIRVNRLEELVRPVCVAAGPGSGRIRFSVDRGPQNGPVGESYSGASTEVPMMSLDDILEVNSPTLLKVDAEGSDGQVLEGASQTLRSPSLKAVLVEEDSAAITSMMIEAGFVRASYAPLTRRLKITESGRTQSAGQTINNLWIRDLRFIHHRCDSAREFNVYGQTF